jgi:hypothetical protein
MVYDILTADALIITPLDHIVSPYNSVHTFISLPVILHCVACCFQIHSIIIIHIFKVSDSNPLCFPQSVQYINYWPCNNYIPMENLIQNSLLWLYFIIFNTSPLLCSWNCVCRFIHCSFVISSFLFDLNIVIYTAVWEDGLLSSVLFSVGICTSDSNERKNCVNIFKIYKP